MGVSRAVDSPAREEVWGCQEGATRFRPIQLTVR
jgi:hypothetical protein